MSKTAIPVTSYINTFRIGSDPEFGILDANGFAVCTAGVDTSNGRNNSEVGQEGGFLIELRPKPAITVGQHLKNIQNLLASPKLVKFHEFRWKAGATVPYRYHSNSAPSSLAIGGHVHVEVPYSLGSYQEDLKNYVPHKVASTRIKAMDQATRFLEELGIHPKEECELRRDRHDYGHFGNVYKISPTQESIPRIEYRTPCSWLLSPNIAFITMTAMKLAVVSPETALRMLVTGSEDKMFESLVKWFRLYQNIDIDSFIAVNKILKSGNVSNLGRLKAKPEEDFRKKWIAKTTAHVTQPSI